MEQSVKRGEGMIVAAWPALPFCALPPTAVAAGLAVVAFTWLTERAFELFMHQPTALQLIGAGATAARAMRRGAIQLEENNRPKNRASGEALKKCLLLSSASLVGEEGRVHSARGAF